MRAPAFFLLLPVRTDEPTVPANYLTLKKHPFSETIQFKKLSKEAIYNVIAKTFSCRKINKPIFEKVFKRTGGNPLFALAFFNTLLEEGILEIKNGELELKHPTEDSAALNLPDSLQAVITNRFDQLTPQQQLTIKVASVIGGSFASHYLQAIYPVQPDKININHLVAELEQIKMIKRDVTADGLQYAFEHQVAQQVVYGLIPFKLRKKLHLKLVNWMEQKYIDNLAPYYPILGYHSEAAEDFEKAAFYWGKVGENASRNGIYTEAEKNLLHGTNLLDHLKESSSILKKRLELLVLLGSVRLATHGQTSDSVRDVYMSAQQISDKIKEDIPQKAIVYFGLSAHHFFSGSLVNTQKYANQALVMAQRMGDVHSQIQAHLMLTNSFFWMADFSNLQHSISQIQSLYQHEDFHRHLSHFAQNPIITSAIGNIWSMCLQGRIREAKASSDQVLELAKEINHNFSMAMIYQVKGFMHHLLQEPKLALEYGERLNSISSNEGFPMLISMADAIVGWSNVMLGKHETGIEQIISGLNSWQIRKAKLGTSLYLKMLLEAYEITHKWSDGIQLLNDWDNHINQTEGKVFLPALYYLKGRFLENVNHSKTAVEWYEKSLALANSQNNYLAESRTAIRLAEIYIQSNKTESALKLLTSVNNPQKDSPYQKKMIALIQYL